MKLPKLNQSGLAHILAPLVFVVLFAAVGGYVLLKSHAAPVLTELGSTSSYKNGRIYSGGYTINPNNSDTQGFSVPGFTGGLSNMSFDGKQVAYFTTDTSTKDTTLPTVYRGTLSNGSIANASTIGNIPTGTYSNMPPIWSPDGTKVAVTIMSGASKTTSGTPQIWVARTDGLGSPKVVPNVQKLIGSYISWLPGSHKIMYSPFSYNTVGSSICTINISGANRNCVPIDTSTINNSGVDGFGQLGLAVSPTGGKVAVVAEHQRSHQMVSADIYIVDTSGHNLRRLMPALPAGQKVTAVAWSPNGTKIAYILNATDSSTAGDTGLYVMNANGSGTPAKLNNMPIPDFFTYSLSWAHQ